MSKIKKYVTKYKQGNEYFGSHIYATSYKEAERLAKERNIAEKILGVSTGIRDGLNKQIPDDVYNPDFRTISDYEFMHKLPQIIHSACFLSYIAMASRKLSINEVVGDTGVVHELIHLLSGDNLNTRHIRRVRGKLISLQDLIPGLFNHQQ